MGGWFSKFDYGTHETAVVQDGNKQEIDWNTCSKTHDIYFDVLTFTKNHFSYAYQEDDLLELVMHIATLTVRIKVNFCSDQRVGYWQNTKVKYPGSETAGQKLCCIGSGRIADVYQDTNEIKTCSCSKCINETEKSVIKEMWTIIVVTATHVVFDDSEASRSSCKLFYDTKDGNCKQINGNKCRWQNVAGDLCFIECVTCDSELAHEIQGQFTRFNDLWRGIRDRYLKDTQKKIRERMYGSNLLVVIVSHPHSGTKKISIGHLKRKLKKQMTDDKGYQLVYDTPTCKGSSGAPVYLYGQDWFHEEYVHSGSNNKQLNYSTTWCPKRDEAEYKVAK